ncbi:MAG: hypothetical protein AAF636_07745 [Pseudomonadota bacterium]
MQDQTDGDVIARAAAGGGRRFLGLGMLIFLGVLLIYIAFNNPPSFGFRVFLVACGASSLMLADSMRRATGQTLELTRAELRDTAGNILVRMEDVKSISRGTFDFKPSNGFLLHTSTRQPRVWRPGLWWRIGKQVGVGGMTHRRETKFMAEMIAAMIAERDQV